MKIRLALLAFLLLLSATAQAAKCQVTYKAKRIQIDRFLFLNVENLKYRSGRVTGKGENKRQCKVNALRKITNSGWTITYSSFRWIS